jgi:hypothetical protein
MEAKFKEYQSKIYIWGGYKVGRDKKERGCWFGGD